MENNWGAFFEHKACERIWINGRKDGETGLFYHNLICPFVGISCCTFIYAIDMHSFMARALPMITPSLIWAKLFFNIHIISYYSFLCWWYGIHILFLWMYVQLLSFSSLERHIIVWIRGKRVKQKILVYVIILCIDSRACTDLMCLLKAQIK